MDARVDPYGRGPGKPPGVVIPWFDGDRLALVKIRQPEGGRFQRERRSTSKRSATARRSIPAPAVIDPASRWSSSEGEFDALLLGQALGDLAAVVTLGSASARPEDRP